MTDELKLPSSVARKTEIIKLVSEFESADSSLTTQDAHAKMGNSNVDDIDVSRIMNDFLAENQIDVYDTNQRGQVLTKLRLIRRDAPVIHISFAAEADDESVRSLVQWFRATIDPNALIEVGVQPALVAGMYMRAKNNVYDYSLKERLKNQRQVLVNELEAISGS